MSENPQQFLDVDALLERSRPRAPGARLGRMAGVFLLVVLLSAFVSSRGGEAASVVDLISNLVMVGLVGGLILFSWRTTRRTRMESMALQAIDELLCLRRWPEAAGVLNTMLSRPVVLAQSRTQGLIFLSGLLARYHRFDDAIRVQDELIENGRLDPASEYSLKMSRTMAMLRQDHLVDADRSINELRNYAARAGRALGQGQTPYELSAGLAVLEVYRDVKTGHSAEAIELFNTTLPTIREQLGHRIADGYVLAARAYDLLGQTDSAQDYYTKATFLAPAAELHRRYPETEPLAGKYRAAEGPKEAA
ncbi:MAG TPA: hypothetical protein VHD56_08475 [Tepidisphaeraceae bacterium]|nr:hypothetical protein [Tepidisphaeraceae bacterium]